MSPADKTSDQTINKADWACRSPKLVIVFLLVAIASLAADLWSKEKIFAALQSDENFITRTKYYASVSSKEDRNRPDHSRAVLAGCAPKAKVCPGVNFTLSANPGVVFGLRMPRIGVIIATIATTLLVIAFFATSHRLARWMHIGLALILGGALGNLYDRIFSVIALPGLAPIERNVRDFIDCSGLGYPWIYNLADVWLVVGVMMIVIQWLFNWLAERRQQRIAKA